MDNVASPLGWQHTQMSYNSNTGRASVATLLVVVVFCMGFLLWLVYLSALQDWLGSFLGFIVAMFVSPGVLVFPIIYRLVEGTWPTTYLWILGGAIATSIVVSLLDRPSAR